MGLLIMSKNLDIDFCTTDLVEVVSGSRKGYQFMIRRRDKERRIAYDKDGTGFAYQFLRLLRAF